MKFNEIGLRSKQVAGLTFLLIMAGLLFLLAMLGELVYRLRYWWDVLESALWEREDEV